MDSIQSYHIDMLIQLNPQYANVSITHMKNVYSKVVKHTTNQIVFCHSLYTPQRTFESKLNRRNKILYRLNERTEKVIGIKERVTSDLYSNTQRDEAYDLLDEWCCLHNLNYHTVLRAKYIFNHIRCMYRRIHKFPLLVACCLLVAMDHNEDFKRLKNQNKEYPVQSRFDTPKYVVGKTKRDQWIEFLEQQKNEEKPNERNSI